MNKEELLLQYLQESDRLVDKLGLEIDQKIKKPVAILRMMGF